MPKACGFLHRFAVTLHHEHKGVPVTPETKAEMIPLRPDADYAAVGIVVSPPLLRHKLQKRPALLLWFMGMSQPSYSFLNLFLTRVSRHTPFLEKGKTPFSL